MFEFEYDDFIGPLGDNGLKIVVRNTADGNLVGYAIDNMDDGLGYCYNLGKIVANALPKMAPVLISRVFVGYLDKRFEGECHDDWSKNYVGLDSGYLNGKDYEMREKIEDYAVQFLKDYFDVNDLRSLVAIDDFFDKKMFVEP